eukprot:5558518-Pyramimonas_sp.AAC.1
MSPLALENLPVLACFDIGRAFSSLCHAWPCRVLGAMLVPEPLRWSARAVYSSALRCGAIMSS